MREKCLLVIVVVSLFMFCGCFYNNAGKIEDDVVSEVVNDIEQEYISIYDDDSSKMMFEMGVKIRELESIPGIDDIVLVVNGCHITKKDIEKEKIVEENEEKYSPKELVLKVMREKVVISEAIKMKIGPPKDKINAYIEQIRAILKSNSDIALALQSYMEGMEITIEQYLTILEQKEYENYQRIGLWEMVKSVEKDEQIQKEANDRGVSVGVVDAEYYEKYVDELMDKAEIQILDEEIARILSE